MRYQDDKHPDFPLVPERADDVSGHSREQRDRIRDHGKIVTVPTATSEGDIIAKLTGADKVPSYEELGKAKAPDFDPHAGREVDPGREFGDTPEAMIATLVFIGVDRGGDFEDVVQSIVTQAEKLGFYYVTASVGTFDLAGHFDNLVEIDEATTLVEEAPQRDYDDDNDLPLDEETF